MKNGKRLLDSRWRKKKFDITLYLKWRDFLAQKSSKVCLSLLDSLRKDKCY